MDTIRTRFAPSPTGMLHIGGLRSALYPYALAKHFKGSFILRIEDTDKKREVPGSKEKISEILRLFGVNWDEYYVQSERLEIYKKAALKLINEDHAFYCQCEAKNAKTEGFSKILRDPCRDKGFKSGAIKLKVPDDENIVFNDIVMNKDISWNSNDVRDATLLKSDGYPTYHLAAMTDDLEMKISHVLRGHDWMPSTPIHLLVFKYLGGNIPKIGHLTDILDPEGGKLSKRKGSTSVEGLLNEGYLPEAILNFIILHGWAPKDNNELFTLNEFINAFDLNGLQKSNPIFNRDKLDWFNSTYIHQLTDQALCEKLQSFSKDFSTLEDMKKLEITKLVKERIKKLTEFESLASFFWQKPDKDTVNRLLLNSENYKVHLDIAYKALEDEQDFMDVIKKNNIKTGHFFMTLRIVITGSKITPPLNESMELLGKEEVKARIKAFL